MQPVKTSINNVCCGQDARNTQETPLNATNPEPTFLTAVPKHSHAENCSSTCRCQTTRAGRTDAETLSVLGCLGSPSGEERMMYAYMRAFMVKIIHGNTDDGSATQQQNALMTTV
jgi:hypothetical protein